MKGMAFWLASALSLVAFLATSCAAALANVASMSPAVTTVSWSMRFSTSRSARATSWMESIPTAAAARMISRVSSSTVLGLLLPDQHDDSELLQVLLVRFIYQMRRPDAKLLAEGVAL